MTSSPRHHSGLLLLLVASTILGCAGFSKERRISEGTERHVYTVPLEHVWDEARTMLREDGFGLREVEGGFEMLTDTKESGELSTVATTHTRIFVKGERVEGGGCRVNFTRMEWLGAARDSDDPSWRSRAKRMRDLELEWKLLQRVDPAVARKLADGRD